jgi:hypothetical protein
MKPVSALLIGVLAAVVIILGYLYYERTQDDVTIHIPEIKLGS